MVFVNWEGEICHLLLTRRVKYVVLVNWEGEMCGLLLTRRVKYVVFC